MAVRRILILFAILALIMLPSLDCLWRDRWEIGEAPLPDEFAAFSGAISLSFERWEHREPVLAHVLIRGGNISRPEVQTHATKYSIPGFVPHPEWAPKRVSDINISQPLARSTDGRFLAAAGMNTESAYDYQTKHWLSVPYANTDLIIYDLIEERMLARIDSGFQWQVEGVAWEPGGERVAVLRLAATFGFCWREIIGFFWLDMPSHLRTYHLDIYDKDGGLIASTRVLSRAQWRGEINWER